MNVFLFVFLVALAGAIGAVLTYLTIKHYQRCDAEGLDKPGKVFKQFMKTIYVKKVGLVLGYVIFGAVALVALVVGILVICL